MIIIKDEDVPYSCGGCSFTREVNVTGETVCNLGVDDISWNKRPKKCPIINIPDNPTNGEVIRALFDDRGYLALKDRMEHTMWWNAEYKGDDTDENN